MLSQLLVELDGVQPLTDVAVIAGNSFTANLSNLNYPMTKNPKMHSTMQIN